MTKKEENLAIDVAKETMIEKFIEEYGFAPSKSKMIPLECSYDRVFGSIICDSLAVAINKKGWSWSLKYGLERNDAYDLQ